MRVTGRVQGVFVRAWTCNQAADLGVGGWVRNCPDGSVEAHVEGEEAAVSALIERMRTGPPSAHVDGLETGQAERQGLRRFDVRR